MLDFRLLSYVQTSRFATLLGALLLSPLLAAQTAINEFIYPAKTGDTLIGIAARLLENPNDWPALQQLNRIANPRQLQPEQRIRIPYPLLKKISTQAELVKQSGEVTIRNPRGSDSAPTGSTIPESSVIQTGENGYVTVKLPDGSLLHIPAASQIHLAKLKRYLHGPVLETQIQVERGRIETQVAKQAPGSRFSIGSPTAIAGVRGTEFRLAYRPGTQITTTEVEEGRIQFGANKPLNDESTKPGQRQKVTPPGVGLAAGYGAVATAQGEVSAPIALLPAPTLPPEQILQERLTLQFKPVLPESSQQVRAIVAADRDFQTILGERLVTAGQVISFPAPNDGEYWLRLRAIASTGLEGLSGETAFSVAARPEPPLLQQPAPNAKQREETVRFNWTTEPDLRYLLQIAKDSQFRQLHVERDIKQGESVENLPVGRYFWRVASVQGARRGPWGEALSLQVLAGPSPLSPPSDEGKTLQFSWGAEPGQTFEAEIARDPEFKQLLLRQRIPHPTLVIARPAAGKYYIRYRCRDSDGYLGPYSRPQEFRVMPRWSDTHGNALNASAGEVRTDYAAP
ncbi:FecR family protein [Parvibium lacunae]|uniref:LysM peptidoglycan-binding domain-containing protein n=1 Tax=Parvibium lacunae TaxID=1888893 RepID=A0A368L1Y2_9BURK|nr:FecR domain-containing protein [Parvibium lacunae]RCS57565.1 LysM peptidoglycan-binding domain-containing protein [Parvibium lacunae]